MSDSGHIGSYEVVQEGDVPLATARPATGDGVDRPRASRAPVWNRALWMRLGALNALAAFVILVLNDTQGGPSAAIRLAAQLHFIHSAGTIACATFMNIGARGARRAPAFLQSGILLYCFPTYADAAGLSGASMLKPFGLGAFATGWLIMAWAAKDIDK